ncbi:MAG: hypothetical protein CL555_18200 [Algoriphagus sp.]|nr:hypothetical protein [Algoriphagus sp.]
MKKLFLSGIIGAYLFLFPEFGYAQGCVAIRQFSGVGNAVGQGNFQNQGDWNISANYRYFKSFRHFRGTHEEPERIENGTQVINWSHGMDLTVSYSFTSRIYALASIPFAYNERSSLYEHGRTERHTTYSSGLGDIRIGAGYWLFPESEKRKGNMAVGLGIKIPSGNFRAEDTFYNVGVGGQPEIRPVDQSIQLGDGGFGFNVDFQGIWSINSSLFAYYSGFYLFNPKNTNGTKTFRSRESEFIMSVPDQYALRGGAFYSMKQIHGLGFLLGGRIEGIPVSDLLGESDGFRRPGYVISVEPGASYMLKNLTGTLTVPLALVRNRTRSLTDIVDSTPENKRHGDAAFADYVINFSLAWRIPKKVPQIFNTL